MDVSRVYHDFQGCFKEDPRKLSRCFKKSFMLHGTHRSFPSRWRACFLYIWHFDCVKNNSLAFPKFLSEGER